MGLFQRLWMNKKKPIPEVVDELKETSSGIVLFLFTHNLWNRSLFIRLQFLA
jgi:hypothetical protein